MFTQIGNRLKNQRGLTSLKLIAVVFILGIISVVAAQNIGGIVDNVKKDVHVSNAQQMVNATRLFIIGEEISISPNSSKSIALIDLMGKGYLENMSKPSGGSYSLGTSNYSGSNFTGSYTGTFADGSYVTVSKTSGGANMYLVVLKSGTTTHFSGNPFAPYPIVSL